MNILEIACLSWMVIALLNINNKAAFYSAVIITNVFVAANFAANFIVEALKVVPTP